jgi:hypothetical protein
MHIDVIRLRVLTGSVSLTAVLGTNEEKDNVDLHDSLLPFEAKCSL